MPPCNACWLLSTAFPLLLLLPTTTAIYGWPLLLEQRRPSDSKNDFNGAFHKNAGRRTLLQSGNAKLAGGAIPLGTEGEWEIYSASHFDAFKEVAAFSSNSSRSVHIVLTNHMVANGDYLPFSINGKLWISGACDSIPMVDTPNHATMTATHDLPVDSMCQFFLNTIKPSTGRFSIDPSQNRDLMSGRSFLRAQNGGKIKLEDVEFAGCYSIQNGGCIRLDGAHLEAERVAFTASTSEGPGGAIWASPSDSGELKSTISLKYPAFWEAESSTGSELYFEGDLGDISVIPSNFDKSAWELVNTGESPPSPPPAPASPSPPFPSPSSPPPAAPPPPQPPMPGNYVNLLNVDVPISDDGSAVKAVIATAITIGVILLAGSGCYVAWNLYQWRAAREEARAAGDEEDDSESDSETGSIDAGPEVLETPVVPLIQSTGAKKTTESSNKGGKGTANFNMDAVVTASFELGTSGRGLSGSGKQLFGNLPLGEAGRSVSGSGRQLFGGKFSLGEAVGEAVEDPSLEAQLSSRARAAEAEIELPPLVYAWEHVEK